jgi:hypothetical protein
VSVTFFSVLFVARLVFRRTWLAAIIYFVFWGAMFGAGSALRGDWIALAEWLIEVSFLLFMTLRFGLFAAALDNMAVTARDSVSSKSEKVTDRPRVLVDYADV